MKRKKIIIGTILIIGIAIFFVVRKDSTLIGVLIGGLVGIGGGIAIEHLRAEREEKFRKEDRAMAVAKSISKNIFHIQNTNYAASVSNKMTPDIQEIAMHALADLEESRTVAIMFLGEKAGDVIADMTHLLSKVVGEIHQRRATDFDIKDCPSFPALVNKHTEIMQMLKDYAEGK